LVSLRASGFIDPFRDMYEARTPAPRPIKLTRQAFTIYTFVQLLINLLGGERKLIVMMYGRRPISHLWPLHRVLPPVDISDPHTFVAIKRGILQYTWIKPMLAFATIIMKATNTYQEGYIGLNSGYLWSGLIYNISITISLYALAMFWVCMNQDLKPFRPIPKFLSIKGIIFASYWQGFFLSILVWVGALPDDIPNYKPDNLAAAIQDTMICFEMPAFALLHWYAFSWHDYADPTISAARLPIWRALRDAFGVVDLIEDSKETFFGKGYDYRNFDSTQNAALAHEESTSRAARMNAGMRYERGKGKYWIPDPNRNKPLLEPGRGSTMAEPNPGQMNYGTTDSEFDDLDINPEEERLYDDARQLEFGDFNVSGLVQFSLANKSQYPVITAHTANRESLLYRAPHLVTTPTNRHLSHSRSHKQRRKAKVRDVQDVKGKGKDDGEDAKPKTASSGSSSRLVDAFGDPEPERVSLLQAQEEEPEQETPEEEQSARRSARYSFGDEGDVWGTEG
jgi:Organic solute transporter Ostalpha